MSPPLSNESAVLLRELQFLVEDAATETLDRLRQASQIALLFGVRERTVDIWVSKNRSLLSILLADVGDFLRKQLCVFIKQVYSR